MGHTEVSGAVLDGERGLVAGMVVEKEEGGVDVRFVAEQEGRGESDGRREGVHGSEYVGVVHHVVVPVAGHHDNHTARLVAQSDCEGGCSK